MLTFDMDNMPVAVERTIETIEGEILVLRNQTAQNIVEIGRRLIEAKGMLQHGQWQGWLEHNVQFSYRTAARFMQVAERFENVSALAGLEASKIYALLDVPADQLEGFVEQHDVENLSARDLQDAIKAKKAADERVHDLEVELEAVKEKADQDQKDAVKAAVKGGEKLLREALTEKQEALRKAREAERKLKEVVDSSATGATSEAAKKQLEEAQARVYELEEQLQSAAKPEIVQQEVEKIPEEVAAELEKLRKIAKAAPSAAIIKLRYAYDQWKTGFDGLVVLIGEAEEEQPSVGPLYREAIRKALDKMADMMKGDA